MADDQHLGDSAAATVGSRERVVDYHHVGGEGVKRCRVGGDKHRVGGADRLQVHRKLAGDMELVEEADEAALGAVCARVGRRLVGDASLAKKIGEAARRAGVVGALQRVGASAIGRAGLATLAGEEEGSRLEKVSGRRCTWPHGGAKFRVVGATYANGWLIIVGASKTSPVPGNGIRRRHARRRILPRFGALRGDNTPTAALRGLRMITR